MTFGYTILYVPDVAASVAFYERAFGLSSRFVHPSGDYAELDTGATALAFASDELGETNFPAGYRRTTPDAPPPAMEICLVTDDVAAAFDRAVVAGAVVLSKPSEKPWGQTVAYVRDADGVIVELATPVG